METWLFGVEPNVSVDARVCHIAIMDAAKLFSKA